MKRTAIFTLVFILLLAVMRTMAQSAVPPRITQAADEQKLVRLAGNTHPLARAQYDRGAAPDSLPAQRMLLLFGRGPDQEAALRQLLEDLQTKSSPQYHQWLTPAEFGKRFGPADADIAAVTNWLQSRGFHVDRVGAGRTVIEFSGTAGLVRQAFRTEIHKFVVNGEEHWANASDPQIPAALAPVVRGIVSLHNFRKQPMHRRLGTFTQSRETGGVTPLFTFAGCGSNCFAVGPGDFATIYNVLPLWNAGIDGTGQSIAIVARTNIVLQDVRGFRTLFGLPANDPVIILNGPDPGLVPGDEGEANLDVQLSGGVAKGATIDLVVSESTEVADGVDLSAFYAVENNLAGVLSLSFSACELFLGTAGNSFFQALWEQAGAQGITVSVAAGDSGSAGCDDFNTQATAANGLAVNGLASTPFNVAVGGTDFDDVGNFSTFWNTTNTAPNRTSAKSYIPEVPLNDSCAQQGVSGGCTSPPGSTLQNIFAGGGGPSNCSTSTASGVCQAGTPKPSWQGGPGVPADSVRDTPDVSIFAGDGQNNSFYVVCEADLTAPLSCSTSPSIGFLGAGGTSASAQAFAGIMALVNHKLATLLNPAPRQGNANFVLYPLAAKAGNSCDSNVFPPSPTCIFYDITKGNNSVPCTAGSLNCGNTPAGMVLVDPNHTSTPAWTTTPGYDLASGLGSINVNNLAANWNTVSFIGTTTTLSLGPPTPTNIAHGTAVAVNITVTPNSGSVKPTGAVSLLATPGTNEAGVDGFILNSNGTTVAGASTPFLPGGSYSVFARYGGDGTFGASDSTPAIPVIVNKENSLTFLNLVINPLGNFTITANPPPLAYGSSYALRADVTNTVDGFHVGPLCSTGCPTGTVTIKDNGALLDGGSFALNGSLGTTEDQNINQHLTPGMHPLTATYSGDNSFNASGPANLTVTINKATSSLSTIGGPAQVNLNALFNLTVTVQTNSNGAAPTGTVTFLDGATALSGTVTTIPTAGSPNGPASLQVTLNNTSLSTTGNHTITATYAGDTNYNGAATAAGAGINISVVQVGSFTVGGAATAVTAGNAGVSNITLTPSGGFTGPVQVSCLAPLPPGVTCPNPPTINVPPGTGQLTVNVAGPSAPGTTAEVRPASRTEYAGLQGGPIGRNGWWKLSAGTGLAAIFLVFLPGRRRYRATLGLCLLCVLSFAMGCGGGSSGGGPIAAATTTKITAPVTKAAQGTSLSFNIAVTASGAPAGNGMVQLFDGATLLTTVPVVNGAVAINNSTLIVGTHAISAHYLGDASTQASQSGAVNVTLTGTTQVTISTNPASSNGNTTFNLTIN